MKKNLLAVAIGVASGSFAAIGATAAVGIDDPSLHFADELLVDQGPAPWVIKSGDSSLAVTDELRSGTVSQEPQYLRFELTNAQFLTGRNSNDLSVENTGGSPGEVNLIAGGGIGQDFAVFGIIEDGDGFEQDDEFTFDLDGNGLTWLNKDEPIVVEMCRYDENQDAVSPDADGEAAIDCREWTLATSKTGLTYMCEKGPQVVADVYAKYGNYKDFTKDYPRNFGNCTLTSSALNPDGDLANLDEYFDDGTKISVFGSGLDGWVDLGRYDSFLREGTSCYSRRDSVDLDDDLGATDTLHVPLFDWDEDLEEPSLTFSVCLDDQSRGEHEPIPITDPLLVSVDGNGLAGFPGGVEDHVSGISRNGIVLRAPFVTTAEGATQRFILTNRGPIDAEYGVTCTPEDIGDGKVDIDYLGDAHGVIPAHETIRVFTRPMNGDLGVVEFDGGNVTLGACVITVAGKFSEIDGVVTTRVNDSGATDSQNMTNDEGYVETTPDILPLDKQDGEITAD